jgi:hypothetical protein
VALASFATERKDLASFSMYWVVVGSNPAPERCEAVKVFRRSDDRVVEVCVLDVRPEGSKKWSATFVNIPPIPTN